MVNWWGRAGVGAGAGAVFETKMGVVIGLEVEMKRLGVN